MGVKNQITETSSLKKRFLEAIVLSPNLNEGIEETPYASEQRVVLLLSAHLPGRYLRNNAVPVGESARDAARAVNP